MRKCGLTFNLLLTLSHLLSPPVLNQNNLTSVTTHCVSSLSKKNVVVEQLLLELFQRKVSGILSRTRCEYCQCSNKSSSVFHSLTHSLPRSIKTIKHTATHNIQTHSVRRRRRRRRTELSPESCTFPKPQPDPLVDQFMIFLQNIIRTV